MRSKIWEWSEFALEIQSASCIFCASWRHRDWRGNLARRGSREEGESLGNNCSLRGIRKETKIWTLYESQDKKAINDYLKKRGQRGEIIPITM
ncbi:hypothetical protein CEXT_34501 [Caerostris extrusa]|uniref:Uncharacterized protein n=1 Tax=Caerostris extrusa TaxID=172846 RepID=A0AAV4TZQ6_CAEEX|nr:hypothetical protein CEXT_34501 [Caerostris extrusa]